MKKALIVTSVASMIQQFNAENIKLLQDLGYQVEVATNFNNPGTIPSKDSNLLLKDLKDRNIIVHNIPFHRKPIHLDNIKAYNQLKKIVNNNQYDIVHCQSPVGGVLTRLASRKLNKTKVIYTAHGLHFFQGAPIKNWVLYYPIERILSKYTDVLITINQKDFELAKKFAVDTDKVEYLPGIGVDTKKFMAAHKTKVLRAELNIPENAFLILSIGEINQNKNHKVIIKALKEINKDNIHYAIAGIGELKEELENLVSIYNLENQVHFLGYQEKVEEIYKMADVFAFPSKREGLGLAAIEAMASGLPLVTSDVHGITDYSINGITGYSFSPDDVEGFKKGILSLYTMDSKRFNKIKKNNVKASQNFDKNQVNMQMKKIYSSM